MESRIIELYPPQRLEKLAKRRVLVKRLLFVLALAALALCVILTSGVNTRNLYQRCLTCIGVSVGTAWIIIYFGIYHVRDVGRELEHARHLTEGPRETLTGRVTLLKLKVRVRNSITLRKVRVETEEGPVTVSVHADHAEKLRRAGERLTLYLVHGYVTAFEPTKEGDDHAAV